MEAKTSEQRRAESNRRIEQMGIACFQQLPVLEGSADTQLKERHMICQRAIACLLSTQLACDISEGNDEMKSREMFLGFLEEYQVAEALTAKEKRLFDGSHTEQDVIDVGWTYEAYWALVWALGLVEDIALPDIICDCERAVRLVGDCSSYEEFYKACHLRDVEEILDMLDLYYRYHWACVEKQVRPNTSIGVLNPDVVMERRRGLEWLVCELLDWDEISMDT